MIKLILLFLILTLAISQNLNSQNKTSEFYPEATGSIDGLGKLNALSIRTQNKVDNFMAELKNKFGSPTTAGSTLRFKGFNKSWNDYEITIRISLQIDINLDKSKTKTLFIYVGSSAQTDLLQPKTELYNSIEKYFFDLYKRTIENGTIDKSLL